MKMHNKPTVIEEVSVYVDEFSKYISETFFLLHNCNKLNSGQIQRLLHYTGERKVVVNSLINAYLFNYNNIREITKLLTPYVDPDELLGVQANNTDIFSVTLKDFLYLRRDWCYYDDGESQIKSIVEALKKGLDNFHGNNALFIGCGVGRIAVELADFYEKVYATDKSFSMIWHINHLISSEYYEFYLPMSKNILKRSHVSSKHRAYIDKERKKIIDSKLNFFVSDVLKLPFQKDTLDSVFSVYFTDVIALKLWFDKISILLKKRGLFIHFGPLDYFFLDETEMLTGEEVRAFIESKGFLTIIDTVIETPHLKNENSMSYTVYKNWLFIAQKQ